MKTYTKFAFTDGHDEHGFSMIEMLIALGLISAVLAVAVNGMIQMQRRSTSETSKTDTVQETRDFIDQVVRDIHDAGYPPARAIYWAIPGTIPLCTYPTGTVITLVRNTTTIACGVVSYSHNQVIFEGDLDGTGVSVVILDIIPTVSGACPCILRRGVLTKTAYLANTTPQYFTEVSGILNSGDGTGTGSAYGVTLPAPGSYGVYATADLFDAYDVNGNSVAPCSLTTTPDCTSIRSLQITTNVVPTFSDPVTKVYPVFSITSKARLNF